MEPKSWILKFLLLFPKMMIKPKSLCSWQKHYTGNSEHLRGFNCVTVYQYNKSIGETHWEKLILEKLIE